jgi:CRISPR-associated protein Cmr4
LERLFQSGWQILEDLDRRVFVQSSSSSVRTLVVEDVVFSGDQVEPRSEVDMVAEALAYLLPPNHEEQTRSRFQKNLIILPDAILLPLLRRVTPVVARIQLTSGKTTSPYRPPGASDEERGNLWYEEHLPMDCLFGQVIGVRPDMAELREYGGDALEWFETSWGSSRTVQLGGNETVGQGLSWWTIGKGESYVTS